GAEFRRGNPAARTRHPGSLRTSFVQPGALLAGAISANWHHRPPSIRRRLIIRHKWSFGMEDTASCDDRALLTRMKALARRGTSLKREANGVGTLQPTDRRRGVRHFSPQEFQELLDAGWVRPVGEDRYVMAKRGVCALRTMLSRPGRGTIENSTASRPARQSTK